MFLNKQLKISKPKRQLQDSKTLVPSQYTFTANSSPLSYNALPIQRHCQFFPSASYNIAVIYSAVALILNSLLSIRSNKKIEYYILSPFIPPLTLFLSICRSEFLTVSLSFSLKNFIYSFIQGISVDKLSHCLFV